ncbi:MAG: ATP-grasp domain-containing protein [Candidatus Chisholmbacteria bacterium]|nr:ATP-grasp domain-containing protein [Candidatus Chisholmbacteria bacterium]
MTKAKEKKNILITCAGGSAPLYLANVLKRKYNVFLVDASPNIAAAKLNLPFAQVPFGNSPKYFAVLNSLVQKWHIDCIVPGADEELLKVSRLCQFFPHLSAVIPTPEFIVTCLNKKSTMQLLANNKISFLSPFRRYQIHYPAIVKPIYGRGSRQVHKITTPRELTGYLKLYNQKFNQILVHPYIGGTEYTVSVIVNNLNELIGIVPKKVIIKQGITLAAVTEKNELINQACKKIVFTLKPQGPFNVQLKVYRRKVYIFEINPRLSTTSVLTDKAFGNEIELYLKYFNQTKIINPPHLKPGVYLYRYYENVFV